MFTVRSQGSTSSACRSENSERFKLVTVMVKRSFAMHRKTVRYSKLFYTVYGGVPLVSSYLLL